jgi:hypothetical protein
MQKLSTLAEDLWPYLLPRVRRAIPPTLAGSGNGGGGGGGNGGGVSGASTLAELDDVLLTNLQNGQFIHWHAGSSKWVNTTLSESGIITAGDGLQLAGSVMSVKQPANSGLIANSAGLAILRPNNSGLGIDANGLTVGAGDGIDVIGATTSVNVTDLLDTARGLYEPTPNNIGINLGAASGLMFSGGQLVMAPPGTLTYASINQTTASGHTHDIASESNVGIPPKAALLHSDGTGLVTLGKLNIYGDQAFYGGHRTIYAEYMLTLQPALDLRFDPGGVIAYPNSQESRTDQFIDSVTGILGFQLADWSAIEFPPGILGANTMGLKLNYLKVDNLFARKFTADEVRVQRGEWFLTRSYGIVEQDFIVPGINGQVDVWFEEAPGLESFKLFLPNNWIMFRTIDIATGLIIQTIYFQVVDAGANDYIQRVPQAGEKVARQQWRLVRRSGGFTGVKIKKGETGADIGQPRHEEVPGSGIWIPDQGIIYATSLFDADGPFIQVQTFDTVIAGVPIFKNRTRMGNLKSVAGYMGEIYGFAAGNDLSLLPTAGFSGFSVEAINGMRMWNTDIALYENAIPAVTLTRTQGLSFLNDTSLFAHDMRMIAWYDNLLNPGVATAKIGMWGNSDDRRLHIQTYGTQAEAIFLSTGGDSDTSAVISIKKKWYGLYHGSISFGAKYVSHIGGFDQVGNVQPRFRIGAETGSQVALSNLHVYANDTSINDTVGMTMEQAGGGDATMHWALTNSTQFVAGIDNSDGNKFKISIGHTLGINDVLTINPANGQVTINGLGPIGTPPSGMVGGDGITVNTNVISVNTTVVRTDRVVSAGDGLQGGGNLGQNIMLAVANDVVRDTRNIYTYDALTGGGGLGGDLHLRLALAGYSGLTQAGNVLSLADTVAGWGLLMSPQKVLSVDQSIILGDHIINAGTGLAGGGALSTDPTLFIQGAAGGGIIVYDDHIGVDFTMVARATTQIIAGNGLVGDGTLANNIRLDVVGGPGLVVGLDNIAILLATYSGLNTTAGLALDNSVAGNGLAISATKVLSITPRDGLVVDVDGIGLNPLVAGNGLSYTAGVIDIVPVATGGLVVTANNLAILLPTPSGLQTTSAGLALADSVAGEGLGITDKVLNVNVSDGLYILTDNVLVDRSFPFVWSGQHTFEAPIVMMGDLNFFGAEPKITTTDEYNLVLAPGGNIELNPGGKAVIPGGNTEINLGDYTRKWASLYATELVVQSLVQVDVQATVGGNVRVGPSTILVVDLASNETTMDVKKEIFFDGHYVILETVRDGYPQFEALKIVGNAIWVEVDRWRYTITRNLNGAGAKNWLAGDTVFSTGRYAGQGFVDIASVETAFDHIGPTVTVYRRHGINAWNEVAPVVTMGALGTYAGLTAGKFGFAAGSDLTKSPSQGFSGLVATSVAGLKMYNTDIEIYQGPNPIMYLNRDIGLAFRWGLYDWDQWTHIGWYENLQGSDYLLENPLARIFVRSEILDLPMMELRAGRPAVGASVERNGRIFLRAFNTGTDDFTSLDLTETSIKGNVQMGAPFDLGTNNRFGFGVETAGAFVHFLQNNAEEDLLASVVNEQNGTGDAWYRWAINRGGSDYGHFWAGIDQSDSRQFKIRGMDTSPGSVQTWFTIDQINKIITFPASGVRVGIGGSPAAGEILRVFGTTVINGATYLRPASPGTNTGYELNFRNHTASYLTSGTYSLGKITALAYSAWNSGFSGNNSINAAEINFSYSAHSDGRTINSKIDFSLQADYSGALTKVATMTIANVDFITSLSHSAHPNGHRRYVSVIPGYYLNGSQLNLVALTLSSYQGVTIRVSYNQFNTGDGPSELVMGMGVATVTRDATTGWFVGSTGYLGTQHLTIGWQINTGTARIMFYLTRTTGVGFRVETTWRVASVEIIGSVSGVVWSPTSV